MARLKHIFLALLALLLADAVAAQYLTRFEHFTIRDGLSNSEVWPILEDDLGFIWLGTQGGLNRFDGVNFKAFVRDTSEHSLINNEVNFLALDQNKTIWVATEGGLCHLDPKTNRVTRCPENKTDGLSRLRAECVMQDRQGRVWVTYDDKFPSSGGVASYDPQTETYTNYMLDEPLGAIFMVQDNVDDNIYWICANKSLCRLDIETGEIEKLGCPDCHLTRYAFQWVDFLSEDEIVVSLYYNGIYSYNKSTSTWRHISDKHACLTMLHDEGDLWWVTLKDSSLAKINFETGERTIYPCNQLSEYALPLRRAKYMQKDNRGNLWITHLRGVSVIKSKSQVFKTVSMKGTSSDGRIFMDASVVSPDGNYIVAGESGNEGLAFIDIKTGEVVDRLREYQFGELKGNPISCTDFSIWENDSLLFSNSTGVFGLDCSTREVWPVILASDPRADGKMWANFSYQDGRIVVAASHEHFVLYDIDRDILELKPYMPLDTTRGVTVGRPIWDDQGRVWIPATNNPGYYDLEEDLYHPLSELFDIPFSAKNFNVHAIETSGDSLVFCTTSDFGIVKMNLKNGEWGKVYIESGAENYQSMHIVEDGQGVLWGATGNGLLRLDLKDGSQALYNYHNGLPDSYLFKAHLEVSENGAITYGNDEHVVYFEPHLLDQDDEGRILLTSVNESEIVAGVAAEYCQQINVANGGNLEFDYTITGVDEPLGTKFYYRLAGHEPDWHEANNRRHASYNSLKGGDYTLQIKARSATSSWHKHQLEIPVFVPTPLWQNAWAQLVLVILGIILIYALFRWRLKRIKTEEKVKSDFEKRIAEVEMTALRAQMNPHFLFNCLNSIKYFIIKNQVDEAADYLTKFSRLIRLILNNSKSELVQLDTELEALHIYIEMEALRFDNEFKHSIEIDQKVNAEFVQIPPLLIQPFVENAIWHGLLHKDGPGELKVSLSCDEHSLFVVIEDNGVGRQKAMELRSKTSTKNKSLGMKITSNRVDTINELYETKATIEIRDLVDPNGQPAGTQVNLTVPI